jgi:hypothetical protein
MADQGKQWIFTIAGILIFFAIFGIPIADKISSFSIGNSNFDLSWMNGLSSGIGQYVFGIQESYTFAGTDLTPYAFIVIFLMIWLIIFVTFGDILETFSMFNPAISWLIAFCLAVIGGMTGVYGNYVAWATRGFVLFGITSVYVGLGFSFVMFLLVEFGLGAFLPKFQKFATDRKLAQQEMKIKSKAIGAANTIEALGEIEKRLEKD